MAPAIPFFSCKLVEHGPPCMYKYSLLLLIFSTLLRAESPQASPQQLVQDAMQKQQAGDLEGAVKEYRQFLKLHPEATPIHSNLGAALAGLGRYEEAVPEYRAALKQTPGFTQARLNLGIAYYKMGRISDAATQLVRVHAEDPGNHQAVLLLGDCYLRMGQNKDVIHLLEPEKRKSADDLAIAYMLGCGSERRGGPAGRGAAVTGSLRRRRASSDGRATRPI